MARWFLGAFVSLLDRTMRGISQKAPVVTSWPPGFAAPLAYAYAVATARRAPRAGIDCHGRTSTSANHTFQGFSCRPVSAGAFVCPTARARAPRWTCRRSGRITGSQEHTVRGFMSTLPGKTGMVITSTRRESGKVRVYAAK